MEKDYRWIRHPWLSLRKAIGLGVQDVGAWMAIEKGWRVGFRVNTIGLLIKPNHYKLAKAGMDKFCNYDAAMPKAFCHRCHPEMMDSIMEKAIKIIAEREGVSVEQVKRDSKLGDKIDRLHRLTLILISIVVPYQLGMLFVSLSRREFGSAALQFISLMVNLAIQVVMVDQRMKIKRLMDARERGEKIRIL